MDETRKIIFIAMMVVLALAIILSFISIIRNNARERLRQKQLVLPEKYASKIVTEKEKKPKKMKKDFFLIAMYKEYVFFYGSGKRVIIEGLVGYATLMVIMFLITSDVVFALLISLSWFALLYNRIDNANTKKRKRYIKDFASAISVMYTAAEAGNTLQASIKQVTERDTIGTRIRTEFANINKDLVNNVSLKDALENFYARNKMFAEIGMFVIIMQFYSLKGGDGLKDILEDISFSLNRKITAYAEIDAELGIYTIMMNVFVYGYFALIVAIKFFMPTFYADMFDNGMQYAQAFGSAFMYMFGIWFYKSMMRGTAEG